MPPGSYIYVASLQCHGARNCFRNEGVYSRFGVNDIYISILGPSLNSTRQSRLKQLIDWCGGEKFEGCLIFDECHKAKHFLPVSLSPFSL